MPGHIAVQDAAAIVADEKEAVKHREGDRGDGGEIHRSYSFPMVTKKGEPTLGPIRKINSRTSFGAGLGPTGPRTREISLQYGAKCPNRLPSSAWSMRGSSMPVAAEP